MRRAQTNKGLGEQNREMRQGSACQVSNDSQANFEFCRNPAFGDAFACLTKGSVAPTLLAGSTPAR
jgi:hypothetical protein